MWVVVARRRRGRFCAVCVRCLLPVTPYITATSDLWMAQNQKKEADKYDVILSIILIFKLELLTQLCEVTVSSVTDTLHDCVCVCVHRESDTHSCV